MKWILVLVLSLGATMVAAQTEEPSLAGLAEKEKKRRRKNTEEGKTTGQLMTNVMPSYSEEQAKEVPKFQSVPSYERALDRTVDKFYEVCHDFAGLWVVCSGASRDKALAACHKGTEDWKTFINSEFQRHVEARWNKRCTDAYEASKTNLDYVRDVYDQLYRDYKKLAAEKGKSSGLLHREIPPSN